MKAMILAAGLGVRMRPLTLRHAKAALPVLNRPLVHWTLDHLARHGVDEVVINVHHLPSTVTRAAGDGRAFGLRVTYSRERTILGTGGGPRKVRRFFGDEPFFLVNGDMVFDFDLTGLLARHRASGAQATLALMPNPNPRRYGPVVSGPDGRVRSLPGLRRRPGRVSLFTGVQVVDPALLDRLPAGPSDSVRDLYAPLIAEGGRVLGVPVRGAWYDLGEPRQYLRSQMEMLTSGFGGFARGSLVDPTATLHATAVVSSSIVGPGAVIADGARVVRSVLWEGARVGPRARVSGCILAQGVRVAAGRRMRGRVEVKMR